MTVVRYNAYEECNKKASRQESIEVVGPYLSPPARLSAGIHSRGVRYQGRLQPRSFHSSEELQRYLPRKDVEDALLLRGLGGGRRREICLGTESSL